jgi:hypothetical protein
MDLQQTINYLRRNGPEIGRLRQRGDKLAARVISSYRYLFDHRADVRAQNELIKLVNEYAVRDLTESAMRDLANRFGHKNDADPIIVPDAIKVQHAVRSALRRKH